MRQPINRPSSLPLQWTIFNESGNRFMECIKFVRKSEQLNSEHFVKSFGIVHWNLSYSHLKNAIWALSFVASHKNYEYFNSFDRNFFNEIILHCTLHCLQHEMNLVLGLRARSSVNWQSNCTEMQMKIQNVMLQNIFKYLFRSICLLLSNFLTHQNRPFS